MNNGIKQEELMIMRWERFWKGSKCVYFRKTDEINPGFIFPFFVPSFPHSHIIIFPLLWSPHSTGCFRKYWSLFPLLVFLSFSSSLVIFFPPSFSSPLPGPIIYRLFDNPHKQNKEVEEEGNEKKQTTQGIRQGTESGRESQDREQHVGNVFNTWSIFPSLFHSFTLFQSADQNLSKSWLKYIHTYVCMYIVLACLEHSKKKKQTTTHMC